MKKVRIIAITLVLVLGLLGVGYAAWTAEAMFNGQIQTADMNVCWDDFFIRDEASGHHSWTAVPEHVTAVAWIDNDDCTKAYLTIDGLYPSTSNSERVAVTGHIMNMGSLPVKFDEVTINLLDNENDVAGWIYADVRIASRKGGTWTVHAYQEGVQLMAIPGVFAAVPDEEYAVGDLLGFGSETENTLYLYLHPDAPNEVQDSFLEFEFVVTFKQFNN